MDSTLHLAKASNGTQLCCPILLDSRAAVLKCNSTYCMSLTTTGFIYVWKYVSQQNDFKTTKETDNMNNLVTLINRQSCHNILREGTFITALLTDNGVPVIYMSRNRSFFFSLQTQCWHQVNYKVDYYKWLKKVSTKNIIFVCYLLI